VTWKLTLEYDGSKYRGWQEQQNARSVMGELRRAAEDLFSTPVELMGAGRTDAGVHALAQVAHLRAVLKRKIHCARLRHELNDRLPADIVVLEVDEAPGNFNARHDAVARRYVYRISPRKTAFWKKYVWWVKEPLNIELMAAAAAKLAGRHDFSCFRATDPARPGESPIVVVTSASVAREDDLILFRIEASHFVWRMVRRLAGVLVKLGKGEITMPQFEQLLAAQCSKDLDVAAWTAPAAGLFLERVLYSEGGAKNSAQNFRR
jgi:tRNA pseudouridine38-40 synthase